MPTNKQASVPALVQIKGTSKIIRTVPCLNTDKEGSRPFHQSLKRLGSSYSDECFKIRELWERIYDLLGNRRVTKGVQQKTRGRKYEILEKNNLG